MFDRSAAIGVRSSCEASATSWRCASIERSSASSVALKLAARRRISRADLVEPDGRSSELVTSSVWRTKRSIGRSAEREITSPKITASTHAGADQQPVREQQPVEDVVGAVSGSATCTTWWSSGSHAV